MSAKDRNYKIFESIAVNQRDLVLTLTPPEPKPEPTPTQRAEREAQPSYFKTAEERSKTLVNQPAPGAECCRVAVRFPYLHRRSKGKDSCPAFLALSEL